MTLAEFDLRDNKITSGPHLAVELASLANLVRLDARHNPFCKGFYEASIALSPPTATAMSLRTMPHELGHLPEVESPGEMRLRWRATVICQLPKLTYLDGLEVDLLERRLGARACASQFGDAPSHSNAMLSPYSSAASPADTHGLSCLDSSQRIVSQLMPTPHFRTSPVPRSASAAFTMDAPTPSSCSLHTTARHRDSEESALQRTNCMPSRNTLSGSTRPTTAWGALFEEEPSATKPRVFDITPPGSTRTCDTLMEAAPSITHEGFLDAAFPGSTRGTGALAQDATSSAKGDEIGIALQSSTRATVGELAPAHVNLDEIGIALQSSTRAIVGELAPAHVNLDSCGSCAEDVPVSEAHLLDKDTLHGAAHTKAPKHDWNANEVNLTEASAERETSAKDARPDSDGNLQRDKANFRSPFGCGIDDSRQACSRSAAGSTCGELSPNLVRT
ncbi:hypothetical protein AB1Y20_019966 [Prymnesium parvum]|uniref:Uncharacterized protein n=1 Tax=Prymnesium parvum TaxID=97485 RepID=A0AB34JTR8_PRYPA